MLADPSLTEPGIVMRHFSRTFVAGLGSCARDVRQ